MLNGKLLLYWYNGLTTKSDQRNRYVIKSISVSTPAEFQQTIQDSLDGIPVGKGYALVQWNKKLFLCQKDSNNPAVPYVRHEIKYHPLASKLE